jgi:hypothetical protein
MKYQIDQSGKIEDTSKDTVIAYSNSTQYAILIPRKVKRQIQETLRRQGLTRLFIYLSFGIGLYFLIEKVKQSQNFVVDIEYPGKDKIIKSIVIELLERNKKPNHSLGFARIGNNPRAHYAAKNVLDKKVKADRILSFEEIMKALKKTDGRLRECFSTLVDARPRSLA